MFHCNQCNREYGGIRGVTISSCPRCREAAPAATAARTPFPRSERTSTDLAVGHHYELSAPLTLSSLVRG